MASEQSMPPEEQPQEVPPVRRGHNSNFPETRKETATPSGNNSPGESMSSDSELPYISCTDDEPIEDESPNEQAHDIVEEKPATASPELDEDIRNSQADAEIFRLNAITVEKQRKIARLTERFSRAVEIAHQLARYNSLLHKMIQDVEELNQFLNE